MSWHDLPYQEITPEVKREIQAMRLHGTLDPKRFVKGGIEKRLKEPIPDRFQFGHIIPSGQSSSTAKESIPKKRSFVEALIEDEEAKKWAKKKFLNDVQAKGASGGKVFWKNLKQKRQKS
ncbi:uncharacterized protein MELLADRAFT_72263 [Melampsora larici-populina 98AG31]|uniref:Fcf2 pre-rRNA processing C-terminal domain-containing protein n=1 Tax=Melampsora larici-populina (strain 98AG31 / pathotype 3-4-7) TaxID=747676 RepID=F4RRQ2_MELLP|nr:uncharacterized protein MELLADRAFT_72263 [Melampsora larici-populina 98AG31]EGG04966.1 hypothetical protein MELLADRAFT_72263 [Melampsora larici-populina 98AG31]